MPFYHVLPCAVATFAPSYLAYLNYGDDARLRRPAQLWMLTHLAIALAMATFLPGSDADNSFNALREIGAAIISAGNAVGIWYALDQTKAPTNTKVLSVGFGWALVPLAWTVVPLFAASREPEFDWATNVQLSIGANVDVCASIALTALVWLFGVQQKRAAKASGGGAAAAAARSPLVLSLAAVHVLLPGCVAFLRYHVGVGSWTATAANALGVAGVCAGTWTAFNNNRRLKRQKSS